MSLVLLGGNIQPAFNDSTLKMHMINNAGSTPTDLGAVSTGLLATDAGILTLIAAQAPSLVAGAPTYATVGAASAEAVAAGATRRRLILINDSDSVIYLGIGAAAVVGSGIRLNAAGGSYTMGPGDNVTAAIYAISGGAAKNLCVQAFTTA